jgi:molybdate transport system substrate-binding protein
MRVLSTLATKGVLDKMRAAAERAAGSLDIRFDATQAILGDVAGGAKADFVIVTEEAMNAWLRSGYVSESRVLGGSGIGIAVRAGAHRPDIGTMDAFVSALLAASSVAHSKAGASGIYFSELIDRLGLRSQLKKIVVVEKGPVGRVVASGDAEIGVQQTCELVPVPGIDIVGPLPAAVQKVTVFAAGIPATTADRDGALALLEFLVSAPARAAMKAGGLEPG